MNVPTKLAAFALALGAAFGVGTAIGGAAGPIDVDGGDEHIEEHAPAPTTHNTPASHEHGSTPWKGHGR